PETVLHLIAAAAPQPWYHRAHVQKTGSDPDALLDVLDMLWLEKLIRKAPGGKETGPGVELTPLGEQVLADPARLDRLRRGEALDPADPGAAVRHTLL